jgi:hypothetical protein
VLGVKGEIFKIKLLVGAVSVLRRVENSNAASHIVPVGFVVLLADDGDRHLWLLVEEVRRGSVPSVLSIPLSPLIVIVKVLYQDMSSNIKNLANV